MCIRQMSLTENGLHPTVQSPMTIEALASRAADRITALAKGGEITA